MKNILLSLLLLISASPAYAVQHKVSIEGFEFNPKALTVETGDTIVWTNADSAHHTATADDGTFDSDDIGEGQSWELTASNKGTFPYHCGYHGHMTGRVIVK